MTYFFHLFSDAEPVLDTEGRECAGMEAVLRYAQACARDIVAEDAKHGFIDLGQSIGVVDEGGKAVLRLDFADAVSVKAAAAS